MLNLILTRYFVFLQRCFDFIVLSSKKHVWNFFFLFLLPLPLINLFLVVVTC